MHWSHCNFWVERYCRFRGALLAVDCVEQLLAARISSTRSRQILVPSYLGAPCEYQSFCHKILPVFFIKVDVGVIITGVLILYADTLADTLSCSLVYGDLLKALLPAHSCIMAGLADVSAFGIFGGAIG